MIFAEMQEIRHFQRLEVWICDNAVTKSNEYQMAIRGYQ